MQVREWGEFAVYRGNEYRAWVSGKRRLKLFSSDIADLAAGFTPNSRGGFVKEVVPDDVEQYFSRYVHGMYRGHEVLVVQERDGKLEIVPLNFLPEDERRDLCFEERERGAYYKWVSPEELDRMWEVKRPL